MKFFLIPAVIEDQPFHAADEGKGELNVTCENVAMLANSAALCQFCLMSFSVTELAELLKAATGFDYDLNEAMECGARIWMLQRGLNNLMGITAADDRIPKRLMTPTSEGGAAGSVPPSSWRTLSDGWFCSIELTGKQILENLTCCGGTVGGLTYRRSGEQVKATLKDGHALDPEATYRVLVNNFIYEGGDNYLFKAQNPNGYNLGVRIEEPVIKWIQSQNTSPQRPLEIMLDGTERGELPPYMK